MSGRLLDRGDGRGDRADACGPAGDPAGQMRGDAFGRVTVPQFRRLAPLAAGREDLERAVDDATGIGAAQRVGAFRDRVGRFRSNHLIPFE